MKHIFGRMGRMAGGSAPVTPPVNVAPTFSAVPVIIGVPTEGAPQAFTAGSYSGTPTPTSSYRWKIDGTPVGTVDTPYTPLTGDVGKTSTVTQTVTNSEGSASSTSTGVAVIASGGATITPGVVVTQGASGIAPHYCFFDAETTTSLATALPWHEVSYDWNFGDAGAGTWGEGISGDSKNVDSGPMAGHVYETPGTYTPTCTMTDGVSTVVWTGSPITVVSAVAPAAWAGAKTILASTSGNFTCAGITSTGTVTAAVASPGVVGWTSHGRSVGDPVYFSTTGALPTGIVAATAYYIIAAGFGASSFQVSATIGGAAINFTGSPSGTHTAIGGAILASVSDYRSWDTLVGLFQVAAALSPAGPARVLLRAGQTFSAARTGSATYLSSTGGPWEIATYNSSGPSITSQATIELYSGNSTVTITQSNPGVIAWVGHKFQALDLVSFSTTGALPAGLSPKVRYYVCAGATLLANSFTVATSGSLASAGTGIDTSASAGSGTHTGQWVAGGPCIVVGSTSAGYQAQNDGRIVDVLMDCTGQPSFNSTYGFNLIGTCNDLLLLRSPVKAASWLSIAFNYAYLNGAPYETRGFTIQDNIGIVECPQLNPRTTSDLVTNTWGYVNGKRLFVAGNSMDANGSAQASSHNFRSFQFEKLILAHNTFADPGSGRHHIKLHSAEVIARTASTVYSATSNAGRGDFRRPFDPVVKGYWPQDVAPQMWRCTTAGTTGAGEPSWNFTSGSTTTDGSVVWTECSADFYAGTMIPTSDCSIRDTKFGNERFYSSEALVTRNKLTGSSNAWAIGVGPLDDDDYSLVYRVLIERNHCVFSGSLARFVNLWGREQTIRNNLIDMSGGSNLQFIYAGHRNALTSSGYSCRKAWVYNNSGFCNATASSTLTFAALDVTAQDVVMKNNIFYTPGLGGKSPTISTGTGKAAHELVASNNTTSFTTSPGFATDPPVALADWKPSGGYTLNGGAVIPVWRDFAGSARPAGAAPDIGAYEQ